MALLVIEGFDDGAQASRASTASGTVDVAYGKNGKGMRVGDTTNGRYVVSLPDVSQGDTLIVGMNVRPATNTGNGLFAFGLNDQIDATWQNHIGVSTDFSLNRWKIWYQNGTDYTSEGTLALNAWYYVELKAVLDAAPNGSWEMVIDGLTVASQTGVSTLDSGQPFGLYVGGGHVNTCDDFHIDNLYICDGSGTVNNDFLGPCKVETIYPSGNGTTSGMTGSDADQIDNYALVDEQPVDTADYVEAATEGAKDTYAFNDLVGAELVHGVDVVWHAQKTDTDAKLLRPVVRSSGTDYTGTSTALSNGTWADYHELFETDPDTSAKWTPAGVNGAEFGIEVRDT